MPREDECNACAGRTLQQCAALHADAAGESCKEQDIGLGGQRKAVRVSLCFLFWDDDDATATAAGACACARNGIPNELNDAECLLVSSAVFGGPVGLDVGFVRASHRSQSWNNSSQFRAPLFAEMSALSSRSGQGLDSAPFQ